MSSIKRDVKKKTPPRPEWRFFLEIQPTVVSLLWRSLALLSILVSFSADGDDAIEFGESGKRAGCFRGNHGSYPRLVAYGYFWLSERA
jgi:hypothetical protein